MRSLLYFIARLLGDINAGRKRRIGKRVERRIAGRITNRFLNKLFR